MGNFGDFEEIKNEQETEQQSEQQVPGTRIRTPRKGEFVGIVVQRLGGNRMEVKCTDGKIRNCRVPGRFKRAFWIRPNDFVIVEPWEGDDEKADIIFHYPKNSQSQLKRAGLLNNLSNEF